MSDQRRIRTIAAACAGTFALTLVAACGGDSPAHGGGAAANSAAAAAGAGGAAAAAGARPGRAGGKPPCSLITRAEAETALGEPTVGDGEQRDLDVCAFHGVGANSDDSLTLTISTADVLRKVTTGNGLGGTVETQTVSGVGDEAIFQPGEQILFVRKGSTGFLVQVVTLAALQNHGSNKDAAVTVAQAVLGRL